MSYISESTQLGPPSILSLVLKSYAVRIVNFSGTFEMLNLPGSRFIPMYVEWLGPGEKGGEGLMEATSKTGSVEGACACAALQTHVSNRIRMTVCIHYTTQQIACACMKKTGRRRLSAEVLLEYQRYRSAQSRPALLVGGNQQRWEATLEHESPDFGFDHRAKALP
jgi:hypothetical protein